MYNMRKKLCLLTMLLFVVGTIIKILPDKNTPQSIAVLSDGYTQASSVLTETCEKFVAHRGYSNYAPENSVPAFELAGKIGFWGIETDISETSDGQFVCMHDDNLDRTTNGSGDIGEHTMQEVSALRIDSGSNVKTTENLKIPTMSEYLSICAKYNCVPVVEIKNVSNYDLFLNEIISSGLESRCIIIGQINDILEIRARNATIPVMIIGYSPAPYTDSLTEIARISDNRGVLYNYPQVDKTAIDIIHGQNIYCGVWSVDDAEVAEAYVQYGADFVVTNEIPARLNSYTINANE